MFLTAIHVLPDGYQPSSAKSTACFFMRCSPQQHVKMLLTEKQTGLCLRFMQPFHFALSVQINVQINVLQGIKWIISICLLRKMYLDQHQEIFLFIGMYQYLQVEICAYSQARKGFPSIAFGWCCLFYSIQKLLLSRVVNPWN